MKDKQPPHQGEDADSGDRRRKIKQILAGGGVIAASHTIPDQWSRAVVESVVLPGHAQTTGITTGNFSGQGDVP